MMHDHYGRTTIHTNGKLTHTMSSNDDPQSDGVVKISDRKKILHYRRLFADLPDPIVFMFVVVNGSLIR
jgi:hypothetical protein